MDCLVTDLSVWESHGTVTRISGYPKWFTLVVNVAFVKSFPL